MRCNGTYGVWKSLAVLPIVAVCCVDVPAAEATPPDNRPLLKAIRELDLVGVEQLLAGGHDVNRPAGPYRWYPLTSAVRTGNLKMVQLLFDHGAALARLPDGGTSLLIDAALGVRDPTVTAAYGHTADATPYQAGSDFHRVSYAYLEPEPRDELRILRLLVREGADPNRADKDGLTPLDHAVKRQKFAAAEQLLALGAKHHVFTAAGLGQAKDLAALLDADPEAVGKARRDELAPLDWAIAAGQQECVELLLDRGAPEGKLEARIAAAVRSGNVELLKFLLDRAEKDERLPAALSQAIAAAIRRNPQAEMVRTLIDHGASVKDDPYLLIMAAQHGDLAIVNLLAAAGAPINAKVQAIPHHHRYDHDEISALHAAICAEPHFEGDLMAADVTRRARYVVALRLLELGADPSSASPGVLRVAVRRGDVELAKKLLAAGADVNDATCVVPFHNATPLHAAVARRDPHFRTTPREQKISLALIDLLLEHGADPLQCSANDYGGRTPLDLAKEYQDEEVLHRLRAAAKR